MCGLRRACNTLLPRGVARRRKLRFEIDTGSAVILADYIGKLVTVAYGGSIRFTGLCMVAMMKTDVTD